MSGPSVFETFSDLVTLEPHGPDVFVGVSPEYSWGRVYGGQVIAQGLAAACQTVDPTFRAHSVHAYFIRGGTSAEPIRYEVDRIRNGRSFLTRLVVARQSNGAILNLACSFQVDEAEADHQTAHPPVGVPGAEDLPPDDWGQFMERRVVPPAHLGGRVGAWVRLRAPLGDHPLVDTLGLAYLSDDLAVEAAALDHPDMTPSSTMQDFMSASLDHALWYHRPAPVDQWQLHVMDGDGLVGGRGLAFGHIFSPGGRHLASLAQQSLLRLARPDP